MILATRTSLSDLPVPSPGNPLAVPIIGVCYGETTAYNGSIVDEDRLVVQHSSFAGQAM